MIVNVSFIRNGVEVSGQMLWQYVIVKKDAVPVQT